MFSGKVFGAVAGAAVLALSATGAFAQAKDKIKVGFIYVGPVGDFGWSYQHDQGRQAIEKAFPGKVTTTFVESVPEADSERAIEQLARTGHDLIFTTSFGFMEPTVKVAKKYPNIKFEHATGFKRAPNLSTMRRSSMKAATSPA
jgi:simple sugar transport system substrate-binding protein